RVKLGWPVLGRLPALRAQREIVDRRLALKSGWQTHQVVIEKPQDFSTQGKFRFGAGAPGRTVDARAMIPRAQQQMPPLSGKREKARNRAVGIAGPIVPARHGIDGNSGVNAMAIAKRAEACWRNARVGGERVVTEAKLANELGHAE